MAFAPLAFAILFLIYPLLSFHRHTLGYGSFWATILDADVQQAMMLSISSSLKTILILLLFFLPLSYMIAQMQKQGKYRFFQSLLSLLLLFYTALPPAILGLILLMSYGKQALGSASLSLSSHGLILVQLMVAMPLFIQQMLREFMNIPIQYDLLARQLGLRDWAIFWKIHLPLVRVGLIKALIFVWARVLGEFGATLIFAGNISGISKTLTLAIYEQLSIDINQAQWMAMILCWFVAVLFLLLSYLEYKTFPKRAD
jgi:molybdate transport system permease protein